MNKDTTMLIEELKLSPDFARFYDENREYMVSGTLSDHLTALRLSKGLTRAEAACRAEMSEDYVGQIFSGQVTVITPPGSYAESYAKAHGLTVKHPS